MGYLGDHWHGRHALWRAFWINFLIPFVLIAMGEPWVRPDAGAEAGEGVLALLYILVTHGIVLPWQIVGLWRSSKRHLHERGDLMTVTFAQLAIVVALVTTAGATTTTVQRIFGYGQGTPESTVAGPRYRLRVVAEEQAIAIDGPFDTGLSRSLRALLAATPGIETIILTSDGGRVFEARGVANQIMESGLDTYVVDRCRSACTIAFIAGARRTLGPRARLGFHRYRMDAVLSAARPLDEQKKDEVFFLRQGVASAFVEQVFATPHEQMWHPGAERLMRANVVHAIVGDR